MVLVAALFLTVGTVLADSRLPENPVSSIFRAEKLFDEGQYVASLGQLDQAFRLVPGTAAAHLLKARVLLELGDLQGSRASLYYAIATGDRSVVDRARQILRKIDSSRFNIHWTDEEVGSGA